MIYHVHLIGGPNDGEVPICFRPYHYLLIQGHTYETDPKGDYVQWVSDDERRIDLFYKGQDETVQREA